MPNTKESSLINLLFSSALLILIVIPCFEAKNKCKKRCDLALASYYISPGSNLNLTYISALFGYNNNNNFTEILQYNPNITTIDEILGDTRLNLPFSCDCLKLGVLGHTFTYTTQFGDIYDKVAETWFANLTTTESIAGENEYDPTRIPDYVPINVTVKCTCGDPHVSNKYGLFTTYPLRKGDGLEQVAADAGVPAWVVRKYNPGVNFRAGSGVVFVPAKDKNGKFPPLGSIKSEFSGGIVAGITTAVITGVLFLSYGLYMCLRGKSKKEEALFVQDMSAARSKSKRHGGSSTVMVDKSVEFSYEELVQATDNFSMSKKIGQGGFGAVYYGELQGQKVAIKKMRAGASESFLAELKVLTNVQHNSLVRLIGYCVKRSLFLVYDFMEKGSLDQHLRGSGRDPLPWITRVQIALDSSRALEYIHEHTVPLYIHRDIKSANILIDRSFRAKVADFGLARLTEAGSNESFTSRAKGTFGYMPVEYAQSGIVSQKTDVFAFGVVLFELISAKGVILPVEGTNEYKGIASMFDEVLSKPDCIQDLHKLIDPRLGDDYPLESVHEMALLARACTQDVPDLRPSMKAVIVALTMMSSSTENWDIG